VSELLEGVRVLDAGILLGATIGMHLADLGADVIKIESPFRGDYQRDFLGQITPHHSPTFLQCNKNQRSLTLNLRSDRGRRLFIELLATADVYVDGFVAGQAEKLGVGYEAQKRVKPDIVYCQFTGFGASGPYATVPVHGYLMSALAGALSVDIDDRGVVVPAPNRDIFDGTASGGDASSSAASYAAMHIAAALVRRARTGEGCKLDSSGADGVIAAGHIGAVTTLCFDQLIDQDQFEGAPSADRDLIAKYAHYRTKDDRIVMLAATEHKFWDNFCRAVGREDLARYKIESKPSDWGLFEGLHAELEGIFATKTLDEWMALAVAEDIPMGPTNRVSELLGDSQISTREILVPSEHPSAGPFVYVGTPVMVGGQPYAIRRHSPELGEHTYELLGELGYSRSQVDAWKADGIV
jgi:crotonobetainyl-CoA:carnitine CoA-transferase CaiB-like acyl-CoA transferase